MKKSVVISLLLLSITVLLISPVLSKQISESNSIEKEINKTVADLDAPDYDTKRKAIRDLYGYINSPEIEKAVAPLISVLKNGDRKHDSYTRSMTAHILVRIANIHKGNIRKEILENTIDEFKNGSNDLVRASCASALSYMDKKAVIKALSEVAEDPKESIIVQISSCRSIQSIDKKSSSIEVCEQFSDMKSSSGVVLSQSKTTNDISSNESIDNDFTEKQRDWLRTHMLFPIDNISNNEVSQEK
jgi:hypothetical protein